MVSRLKKNPRASRLRPFARSYAAALSKGVKGKKEGVLRQKKRNRFASTSSIDHSVIRLRKKRKKKREKKGERSEGRRGGGAPSHLRVVPPGHRGNRKKREGEKIKKLDAEAPTPESHRHPPHIVRLCCSTGEKKGENGNPRGIRLRVSRAAQGSVIRKRRGRSPKEGEERGVVDKVRRILRRWAANRKEKKKGKRRG